MANLRSYKYVGEDLSLLAKYIMQPFWKKTVNLLPKSLAPNAITLLGLFGILIMFFCTISNSPTATESLPPWVYLVNAFCIFYYQTMDAWDGKQARRLVLSSALGELFDHGCDAISTVLITMTMSCVLRIGCGYLFFININFMLIAFYIVQWELYFTNNLVLWYLNVTEGQFLAIALNIISYLEPEYFVQKTTILDMELTYGQIVTIPCAAIAISTCFTAFFKVFTKNLSSSTKFKEAIISLYPCFITSFVFSIWAYNSPNLFYPNCYVFCVAMGFVFGGLVGRILLARVTKMTYSLWYYIQVPMFIGAINSFLPKKIIDEEMLVIFYCCFVIVAYIHFALCIIQDFTAYNGIPCFGVTLWDNEEIERRRKRRGIVLPKEEKTEKKNN
jgi:ethanolaminephosphotransferase